MQKEISENTFTKGVTSDFSDNSIPNNMAALLLNLRQDKIGRITNVKGNTLISFDLPEGENLCIGRLPDEKGNRLFSWICNANSNHCILEYNSITNTIEVVVQSPLLNFDKNHLVINPFLIGDLLYWVDSGYNNPRKVNIKKIKEYTGGSIYDDLFTAYKKPPFYPPTLEYITDTTRDQNLVYGNLIKAAYRNIYDDDENSVFSDFSKVPLPIDESYRGEEIIGSKNNAIKITINTGNENVDKLEIAVKISGGNFKSVKVLDKKKEGIPDNSTYDFIFYNDGDYGDVSLAEISRPYDFMPDKPFAQELLENRIIAYVNFDEGFENVEIEAEQQITHIKPDFSGTQIINDNDPSFTNIQLRSVSYGDYRGIDGGEYRCYECMRIPSDHYCKAPAGGSTLSKRNTPSNIKVGADVKAGNTYTLSSQVGFIEKYKAKAGDSAQDVLLYFRKRLFETGNAVDVVKPFGTSGDYQLNFVWVKNKTPYASTLTSVTKNNTSSIAIGTNKSLKVSKENSRYTYAIQYERAEGKKYPAFSVKELTFHNPSINELGEIKYPVHTIKIKNRPPIDAVRYSILRTENESVKNWLWFMTMQAIPVVGNSKENYIDLVIDGLDIFKKLYPKTNVYYQFAPGDRLRLIKNETSGTFYPNFETEILEQRTLLEETVNANITTVVNQNKITVDTGTADIKNIGKFIEFQDERGTITRRKITAVETTDQYTVNEKFTVEYKRPSFKLIDARNILRIKKPESITINDFSLIEVFTPANGENATGSKNYYSFGEKFDIINPGLESRAHSGSVQMQDPNNPKTIPAILSFHEGDAYMRNRELPTNNVTGNIGTKIDIIIDKHFTDFYKSDLNDNGRLNVENPDTKIKHYGARIRTSLQKIEDTKINRLNSFEAEDRYDYEDKFGDINLILFNGKVLFVGKEFKLGYIPIYETLTRDSNNNQLFATSNKLLNPIQYYIWSGGLGKNIDLNTVGTQTYGVSSDSGVAFRHSVDGIEPISTTFFMDQYFKGLLKKYGRLNGVVKTGIDIENNEVVYHFQRILENIYNDGFTSGQWELKNITPINPSTFEIISGPSKGTLGGINADGSVIYTSNPEAEGPESFSYRVKDLNGNYLPVRNLCFPIVKPTAIPEPDPGPGPGPDPVTGPNDFNWINRTGLDLNTEITSNTINITGLSHPSTFSVTSYNATIYKNGIIQPGNATVVVNGDTLLLKSTTLSVGDSNKSIETSINTLNKAWNIKTKIIPKTINIELVNNTSSISGSMLEVTVIDKTTNIPVFIKQFPTSASDYDSFNCNEDINVLEVIVNNDSNMAVSSVTVSGGSYTKTLLVNNPGYVTFTNVPKTNLMVEVF